MKKILIPFSGGLDSTYLVYKTLSEKNIPITTYFSITNNGLKPQIERIHRKLILEKINNEFNTYILDYESGGEVGLHGSNSVALPQPLTWIYCLHFLPKNYDVVQLAYVLGDHAVSFIKDIKKLIKAYQPFLKENVKVKIEFPLTKLLKEEICDKLPEEIKELIWTCENPKEIYNNEKEGTLIYQPCNKCTACKHSILRQNKIYIYQLKDLTILNSFNEFKTYLTNFSEEIQCLIKNSHWYSLNMSDYEERLELKKQIEPLPFLERENQLEYEEN